MSLRTIRNNLLFWKITGVFSLLLISLGFAYIGIAGWMAKRNFNAINEQLYGDVAAHLARNTAPFRNGRPDTAVTHDIIHSIMLINPSVEVYLLDTSGRIVDFVVPDKTVKTSKVDLRPVFRYIQEGGKKYVTGDNPKTPASRTIFSAAPVYEGHRLTGYVYAILASQKQAEVAAALDRDFYSCRHFPRGRHHLFPDHRQHLQDILRSETIHGRRSRGTHRRTGERKPWRTDLGFQ
jgi:hypothetical protein